MWAKIPGLPERYEISPEGEVRMLPYEIEMTRRHRDGSVRREKRRFKGRTVKPHWAAHARFPGGAQVVRLATGPNSKSEMRLDLLVAKAFLGCPYDPSDQRDVQRWRLVHKDGDKTNCHVDNLEWVEVGNSSNSVDWIRENRRKWEERKGRIPDWLHEMYADEPDDELVEVA